MAKTSTYWDKRAIKRLTDAEKHSDVYINRVKKVYEQAYKDIDRQLASVYKNYSKETGLDTQKLKELLTRSETKKTWEQMKRQGLDKYIKDNYKSRISRLEQLQAQIYAKAKEIYPKEELEDTMCYKGVINQNYYKTMYDIQMGTGYDFDFATIDNNMITRLLQEPWSGKNYSERIWTNTDILADNLSEILGGAMLSGQSIELTAKQIRDRFNVSKYYAERLIRTETNHFNNEVDAMAYEELGLDKYVFVATLDNRTSDICQAMDNKVFKYSERVEGINYPPLHPNCRSTTRGYLGKEEEKALQRRARNPITGKTELVDNMSYNDWYKKNVNKYGQDVIDNNIKMQRNKASDQNQYDKYIKVLGKDNMPSSIDKWQDLKYNNINEYKLTKYNYKLRNEVIHNPQNVINTIDIDNKKYTDYLFGGNNDKGIIKGNLINDVLGYNIDNYNDFDKLIKDNIKLYPKRYKDTTKYGDKYEVNMVVKGLKDRQAKLTIGVISKDDNYKLTSIYIEKLKESELKYDY